MKKLAAACALVLSLAPVLAAAQQVDFGGAWKEQRFKIFGSNDYVLNGTSLGVTSDGTVSLLWRALPQAMWSKKQAAWNWAVNTSVPATNLSRKGSDDRNIALYFIFLPEAAAQAAQNQGVRALLDNPDVRVLMYIWGGNHTRDQIVASPYLGSRGFSIIKRAAGTGSAFERVDLARDHQRVFGEAAQSLVGLAVSSDSDDTDTSVSASISRLRLE